LLYRYAPNWVISPICVGKVPVNLLPAKEIASENHWTNVWCQTQKIQLGWKEVINISISRRHLPNPERNAIVRGIVPLSLFPNNRTPSVCDKQIRIHINEHAYRNINQLVRTKWGKSWNFPTYQVQSCFLYSRTECHSIYYLINQEPLLFTNEDQMEASRLKRHVHKKILRTFWWIKLVVHKNHFKQHGQILPRRLKLKIVDGISPWISFRFNSRNSKWTKIHLKICKKSSFRRDFIKAVRHTLLPNDLER
jgi:hypothetical protein